MWLKADLSKKQIKIIPKDIDFLIHMVDPRTFLQSSKTSTN